MAATTGAGPVNGLFEAGITVGFVTGDVEVDEETRSLTRMVCGAGPALPAPMPPAEVVGFAASDDGAAAATVGIAETAVIGWAIFADSTFFNVSSTSAATHPAPVSVVLMVSRETPSFICALIYSTIDSCTMLLIFYFLNDGSTFYFFYCGEGTCMPYPGDGA
jgi:hypothetical protein